MAERQTGTVARWTDRGFGFITPDAEPVNGGVEDEQLFVHFSSISDGNALAEGAMVEFDSVFDEAKGKFKAENVTGGITQDRSSGFGKGRGGGGLVVAVPAAAVSATTVAKSVTSRATAPTPPRRAKVALAAAVLVAAAAAVSATTVAKSVTSRATAPSPARKAAAGGRKASATTSRRACAHAATTAASLTSSRAGRQVAAGKLAPSRTTVKADPQESIQESAHPMTE
eukprot:CAMPEP_0181192536 /NCGR_PEP_ID=MMETSP1096-20121128/13335_1 /TAXON_ID=156174 ORGANISM="Chrysochromulina ericina, Strain CCMP281" /NCGR_SAMPLE_ID=MMETSP1096 /ASSEMBLY_ACC=CAM_ASM_000453 /LENGTH=227 /DNA_ID=CAMNT_0023281937 /DNA_START=28 /DNA_END=713 /DNA_ORIENTATION=-